ncbi:MAG TPA: porin family protein [Candidatus Polarisedimenticolaceae bacterium]|nr:porin family protein [Candidatus Polarisedimenticolaceae bacterium]
MKRWVFCLVASAICVPLPASAAGGYLGGSWLSTSAEFDTAVENFDTDESGWKVFAGFDAERFFGVEVSYRDMGDFSEVHGLDSLDADIDAWEASLRGLLPLGRVLQLFAKFGYANVSFDGDVATGSIVSADVDADGWDLIYGVGIDLNLGERFGLRAEWEEFDVEDSLNSFSAGAFFRF